MRQFTNIVGRWMRRLFGARAETVSTVERERCVETGGAETDRAFVWNGIQGHEWEEFER